MEIFLTSFSSSLSYLAQLLSKEINLKKIFIYIAPILGMLLSTDDRRHNMYFFQIKYLRSFCFCSYFHQVFSFHCSCLLKKSTKKLYPFSKLLCQLPCKIELNCVHVLYRNIQVKVMTYCHDLVLWTVVFCYCGSPFCYLQRLLSVNCSALCGVIFSYPHHCHHLKMSLTLKEQNSCKVHKAVW